MEARPDSTIHEHKYYLKPGESERWDAVLVAWTDSGTIRADIVSGDEPVQDDYMRQLRRQVSDAEARPQYGGADFLPPTIPRMIDSAGVRSILEDIAITCGFNANQSLAALERTAWQWMADTILKSAREIADFDSAIRKMHGND